MNGKLICMKIELLYDSFLICCLEFIMVWTDRLSTSKVIQILSKVSVGSMYKNAKCEVKLPNLKIIVFDRARWCQVMPDHASPLHCIILTYHLFFAHILSYFWYYLVSRYSKSLKRQYSRPFYSYKSSVLHGIDWGDKINANNFKVFRIFLEKSLGHFRWRFFYRFVFLYQQLLNKNVSNDYCAKFNVGNV